MIDRLLRIASLASLPLALAACDPSPTGGSAAPANDSTSASPTDETASARLPNAAAAAPGGTSGLPALPEPFRGRWDASAAACAGPRGEMRLDVEPDRIRFYESVAQVQAVRPAADGSMQVNFAFEGEGERWTETRTLRLLADGRLSVETADGSADRVRCD